jgi:hydrogenase-4 component B
MALSFSLWCAAALLALGVLAILLAGNRSATTIIYTASLLLTLGLLANAILRLLANSVPETTILPLGLPWVGAHFRLDALAAAFLVVVNLGAAGASLYGLGYGRHEISPSRVLPFYPVFLAGMNLVVLADDAFSFLLSWEFMSLSSWALVMAHHRVPENRHAGYVYILMASFGTLALLLAFGLLAGPQHTPRAGRVACTHPCSDRCRIESWTGAAACLASPRPSGGAEPCFGTDERRDDEGRGLRLCAHRV